MAELLLGGYDVDSSLYTVPASNSKPNANMTQEQTVDRFRQLAMFGGCYKPYTALNLDPTLPVMALLP